MQPPVLSSSPPQGQQQQQSSQPHEAPPYSDAHVASTLSLMPFSDFCKLRDDWAAKPLIRGRYRGLCGGDPAQRERREDFESITLTTDHDESDEAHFSASSSPFAAHPQNHANAPAQRRVLPGQVEAYSRSAAGKIIDPTYQRTPLALEKTMHFLVEHYMRVPHTPLVYTDPFRIWNYLWDRFRGIRTTWGPQLPPSNVSVKGYVDSETNRPLAVGDLRRESYRRVRWLEFTAAALAVGGAYLCLTPKGCQRFMQDKKQFLESMSQCFTDLTVFYRAEQRHRNAEFFSVLLLLYGLNQEMKVEDRATFCRFHHITVDGTPRLCPELPAESVNLAQVNRELEKQPYMMEAQPVRAALELIYCWSTRRWFAFFDLCKTAQLTPLQRAVVFQSFTYARFRAVLDLVLPNYYVYTKLRVRDAMAVAELADQLMMDPAHCLQFLKSMGLESQLEFKSADTQQQQHFSESGAGIASPTSSGPATSGWYLNLSQPNSDPLVTAEVLEERCQNKRVLFYPTYPEFFGFRVWRAAYRRFPAAAGLARPTLRSNTMNNGNDGGAHGTPFDFGSSSPAGRGAVSFQTSDMSFHPTHNNSSPQQAQQGHSGTQHQSKKHRHHRNRREGEMDDEYGGDDFYTDEYTQESEYDDGDSDDGGAEGDDYHSNRSGSNSSGRSVRSAADDAHAAAGSAGSGLTPPTASPTKSDIPALSGGHSDGEGRQNDGETTEAALLRQPGCPINLMEVLEVYCPPYHDEVAELTLVDASQDLFASLQAHRSAMLRRCQCARRRALRWQTALATDEHSTATADYLRSGANVQDRQEGEEEDNDYDAAEMEDAVSEHGEAWLEKMEQESVSTCSSIFYSEAGEGEEEEADDDEFRGGNEETEAGADREGNRSAATQMRGEDGSAPTDASVPRVIAEARQLVRALNASTLYAEAAADQVKQREEKARRAKEEEERTAAAASAAAANRQERSKVDEKAARDTDTFPDSPTPHNPFLALPETASCHVVPLPDDYGDANEHRCNSQTTHVVVESPATLQPISKRNTFSEEQATTEDAHEGRDNSAETVVPHQMEKPRSSDGGGELDETNNNNNNDASFMSKLFPNRPGAPAFGFGSAKSAIPPLQFHTAMPTSTMESVKAPTAPTAAAPRTSSTEAEQTTTPKAPTPPPHARGSTEKEQKGEGAGSRGDSSSSSSSSAPRLEYSHLKRHTKGRPTTDSRSNDEESEGVEEWDIESESSDNGERVESNVDVRDDGKGGEENVNGVYGGNKKSAEYREATLSRSTNGSTERRATVHIPPIDIQAALASSGTAKTDPTIKSPRAGNSTLTAMPGTSTADSFTPHEINTHPSKAIGTRRPRSSSRDDEDTCSRDAAEALSSIHSGDDASNSRSLLPSNENTMKEIYSGLVKVAKTDGARTAGDATRKAAGNRRARPSLATPRPLPLAPHEVNAFAEVCLPFIMEYLALWTQLTHGDGPALQAAAQCVLDARRLATESETESNVDSGDASHVSLTRYSHAAPQDPQQRRSATLRRAMARRAEALLTRAVLRGSMSEFSQCMMDAAVATSGAAAVQERGRHGTSAGSFTLGRPWSTQTPTAAWDTTEVRAALFSCGCSAAQIPRYEVEAMLAVESGAVPMLTRLSSTKKQAHSPTRFSLSTAPHANQSAFHALTQSLSAARRAGVLTLRSGQATRLQAACGAASATLARLDNSLRGLPKALESAAQASLAASGAPAHPTSSRLSTSTLLCSASSSPLAPRVVFDPTVHQYVVWSPSAAATFRPSSGALDAAVLQLTSTFIFVSSEADPLALFQTAAASTCGNLNREGNKYEDEEDDLAMQQRGLSALFKNEKERWLAQLLLPSPLYSTVCAGAAEDAPLADLRNDRMLWLSAPASKEAAAAAATVSGDKGDASPLVARLYQRDQLTHIPTHPLNAQDGGTAAAAAATAVVPLATRVGLYSCEASALCRLRVRRDGGVRLLPRNDFTHVDLPSPSKAPVEPPPSTVTTQAMSHSHYTAVVAVDLASPLALPHARRTLRDIVKSHVPLTRRGETVAATVSAHCVSGVLICLLNSAEARAAAAAVNGSSDASDHLQAVMDELKCFFEEEWVRTHGGALTLADTVSDISSSCRRTRGVNSVLKCREAKAPAASVPVIVGVGIDYGVVDSAVEAMQLGMQTLMTNYAQRAVAVLGEA